MEKRCSSIIIGATKEQVYCRYFLKRKQIKYYLLFRKHLLKKIKALLNFVKHLALFGRGFLITSSNEISIEVTRQRTGSVGPYIIRTYLLHNK